MNCKQGTQIIADQIREVLARIDTDFYTLPLGIFNDSTIGQHFRHIIDFYGCLCRGLTDGLIDYAHRARDHQIEISPQYAAKVLDEHLQCILQFDESQPLDVLGDFSSELEEQRPLLRSTLGRELMYAYDHAVHHLAMIKMGLKSIDRDASLSQEIGVAPSTLRYWKQKK